jgi:hypothetical protein
LQTLQNDLLAFSDFCNNIANGYEAIAPHFSRAHTAFEVIQEHARRIARAIMIADEAAASPLFKHNPPSPLSRGGKTPVRAKTQQPRPILNERQMAQQSTLAAFFTDISHTANSLKSLHKRTADNHDGIALFTDHLENDIKALEEQGLCELTANNKMLEQRNLHGSTASRFMAEAHNITAEGNDSYDSSYGSSERSSDREFLQPHSQESEIQDAQNPRFIQARREIREAAAASAAAEIIAVKHIRDLPPGFCLKGHRYDGRPTLRKGKTATCAHCSNAFTDGAIYTCSCFSYACVHCLMGSKTGSPPPKCPKLKCTGSCTLRFKPLTAHCFAGNHDIPRDEHFWMCSERRCQAIICSQCASNANTNPQITPQVAPSNLQSPPLTAAPLTASAQRNNSDTSRPAVAKGKPPNADQ